MQNLSAMLFCIVTTLMAVSVGLSLWCETVETTDPKTHTDSLFSVCEHCKIQYLAELENPKQFVARTRLVAHMSGYVSAMSFVALFLVSASQLIELCFTTAIKTLISFTPARIAKLRATQFPKTRQTP
ncbi:hypothetical protein [Rubripirellula reticaptiva]|uniref:Uncharacterized protein n=1 Tax=Rubripirellula reticaptiva TaxID=2528013 RepID=A0A5C6EIC9_9BACT|nr:hypothetical protein [Rubripirellula reticaptiva]TWU49503.1 hypothetical protein Poly59_41180 [Rubripirellula reticaptiva]